jgi:hypothetical protein
MVLIRRRLLFLAACLVFAAFVHLRGLGVAIRKIYIPGHVLYVGKWNGKRRFLISWRKVLQTILQVLVSTTPLITRASNAKLDIRLVGRG